MWSAQTKPVVPSRFSIRYNCTVAICLSILFWWVVSGWFVAVCFYKNILLLSSSCLRTLGLTIISFFCSLSTSVFVYLLNPNVRSALMILYICLFICLSLCLINSQCLFMTWTRWHRPGGSVDGQAIILFYYFLFFCFVFF